MLPSSTEVRVPLLLLKRFVTAFGNVRQWLGERVQMTKLASMFCPFFQGVFKYSSCLRQPAVSRSALSPTLVIVLEFIILLMLIIAPCAMRCVWKVSSTARVWNLFLSTARLSLCKQPVLHWAASLALVPLICKRARFRCPNRGNYTATSI